MPPGCWADAGMLASILSKFVVCLCAIRMFILDRAVDGAEFGRKLETSR